MLVMPMGAHAGSLALDQNPPLRCPATPLINLSSLDKGKNGQLRSEHEQLAQIKAATWNVHP